MEILGYILLVIGLLMFLVNWIRLIMIAFAEGGVLWGILIIFFSWFAGIVFCIFHKMGWIPLILMFIGGVIMGLGAVPFSIGFFDYMY